MRMSLVIGSRNRARQLERSLAKLNLEAMKRLGVDVALVDSASEDDTSDVMVRFAREVGVEAQVFRAERPGASLARNVGARAARGDVLIFTDDDCYLDADYFDVIVRDFQPGRHHYGGGDTRLFDPDDGDTGVTPLDYDDPLEIPPRVLLTAGAIQAANMVFLRATFERLGGFDERLGAGTPFPCEDIELCARASLNGYIGLLMPAAKVLHHHGRKAGTYQFALTEAGYARGRGTYYVHLISRGQKNAWDVWSRLHKGWPGGPMSTEILTMLRNEMRGAADYLDMVLAERWSDRK